MAVHESDPLLAGNKVKTTTAARSNTKRMSSTKILLGVTTTLIIISTVAVLCHNKNTFRTQQKEWWQDTPNVPTIHTHISSFVPKIENSDGQLRWGVLGLGRIASDFTSALKSEGANVTAVAAGSLLNATSRAQAFARLFDIPQSYGT